MTAMHELEAYLRGLPDDWGSWLVYADALSERGDERGQLLVLEHAGESIDSALPSGVLRAPAKPGLAISERMDDWMHAWRYQLHDDDFHQYETFRRLAVLATRAPADLRPVFAHPISQLLALLDPDGGDQPGLSPVFELQRDRTVSAVLAWIDRAFDGVPAPDEAHRTLCQAEAADNYATCDRSADHLGRWQDLPDDQLLDNQWALAHLDDQGIHYYIPAAMSFALRQRLHPRDLWITESLEYTLQPSNPDLRDYEQSRFTRFDREQRAAIYAFTLARGHATAAAAWGRVFEAERDAARSDWFELYSPP